MPGPYYHWPGNLVDNCHAQRDSLFPVALPSQRTFALSIHHCPPPRHCPACPGQSSH
ncbi:hypothetical protein [Candidatus Spongiihabitans sp.]|uniref:hypothetical protein n=1 Tax=Candidatus Spongiihabitans sp. TaxID=3101308 RepID=UPI003C7CD091